MDLKSRLSALSQPLERPRAPDREATLAGLRLRMAELLVRDAPSRAEPPPALGSEALPEPLALECCLPFDLEPTEAGDLWCRRQVLPQSTHVGRIPLDAARDASTQMLALLALSPELGSTALAGALFLDTETTGLGGAGTLAFLVGLAWFDEQGRLVLEQLLLKDPSHEVAMLHHLRRRFERSSLVVTYNGKSFDLPLLASRFVMNRLPEPESLPHLDLLHVARRLHKERLGHCHLTSLESGVLGFERADDISGAEIPPLYGHYLRTRDGQVLLPVVEHNAWDVMTMAALTGLYGEPLGALHQDDLVGLARTLKRAGALSEAARAAAEAVRLGAGPRARFVSAQIAKARGDRAKALADFEALSAEVDDSRVHLELAKLYEHYVKQPLKALAQVERGTGECPEKSNRRRERLVRKYMKYNDIGPQEW